MITELACGQVFWLIFFPNKFGVSDTLIPQTIMTGLDIDYNKHCQVESGQYVHTQEEHGNGKETRTVAAVAFRPNGYAKGGYMFYSLSTDQMLDRTDWTELTMPDNMIKKV